MADDRQRSREDLEDRRVTVDEPELSRQTNELLTDEVRAVVGDDHVSVPRDRDRPSRRSARGGGFSVAGRPRSFIVIIVGSALVVVAAVVALVTDDWWLLPVVVAVLGVFTYVVVATVLRMTANPERPSPTTAAAMEEEGIVDPERHFSGLVAEYTPEDAAGAENRRTVGADADPATGAAEQRGAITPTGGPSDPVGPDEAQQQGRENN
jgi:hypothetical protein